MRRLVVLLFLFQLGVANAVVISEIMYNPSGSDAGREWLEIYNNGNETYNLTGWKVNTDGTDHALNVPPANGGRGSMLMAPGEYAIIAQNASYVVSAYAGFGGTVIDSSWKDLSNSADELIWIRNSTRVFDNITHSPLAAEGNTSCLISGSFVSCTPTPGAANSLPPAELPQEQVPAPPAQSTPPEPEASQQEGAAAPAQPATEQAEGACDVSVEIRSEDVHTGAVDFDILVNNTGCSAQNVTINYFIEDLFGTMVKPALDTTAQLVCSRTISRQWTPRDVQGSEAYRIVASITGAGCSDTDEANDNASKLIIVKGISEINKTGAGAVIQKPDVDISGSMIEAEGSNATARETKREERVREAARFGQPSVKAASRLLILFLMKRLA